MLLEDYLPKLAILRQSGEPDGAKPISLVLLANDLRRVPVWHRRRKHLQIANIFLADLPPNTQIKLNLPDLPQNAASLDGLADTPDNDVVFLFAQEWPVRMASMAVPGLAAKKVWLAAHNAIPLRKPLPDFFKRNSEQLERAFALLQDPGSRECFARRVLALQTGDPGWLAIAPFLEYQHPEIHPQAGDVMLDGGVSDMTGAQAGFCQSVGATGRIFGFEPIRWMAIKAASELAQFPNYRLTCAGLADKPGQAEFASLRDSSHLGALAGAESELCTLTTIDRFAAERSLPHIDCIKLDIEGAELAALQGGAAIIKRDLPRLIICLYHKPQDLFEIPLYLNNLHQGWDMRIAHSSAGFTDTILYAQAAL